MRESPLIPGGEPDAAVTLEQMEEKIGEWSREIQDLIRRQGEATDMLLRKSLELQLSLKINERARLVMRKQEFLQKGAGEA